MSTAEGWALLSLMGVLVLGILQFVRISLQLQGFRRSLEDPLLVRLDAHDKVMAIRLDALQRRLDVLGSRRS